LKHGATQYYFATGRGPSIETASEAIAGLVSRSGVKLLSKPGLEKKVIGMNRRFFADGLKHAIAIQGILELSCGSSKYAARTPPSGPGRTQVDQLLEELAKKSPTVRWSQAHGMWSTGSASPRAFMAKALDYHLRDGVAEQISCPTLVCEAEDDLFFKGQPRALYDHLTCRKALVRFTSDERECSTGSTRRLSSP
jgi:hypothetical protein